MNRFLSLIMLLLLPAFALGQSTAIVDGIGLANGKSYTNYIKNPNAQKNTVNVTASNLTVARSITTPLYSTAEFNLTSTSTPWSATWSALAFNEGMKNRLCEVQIMLRGTAAGTTTLEVLQNSVAVFTQTVTLDATNPKKYGGTFPCGDLTYASTVKLSGTGATTGAIEVGNVYLGEPVSVSSGGIMTEWQSYTPTITGSTTNPTKGTTTEVANWRRVGSNLEIEYSYFQTGAGSAGSGDYYWSLPNDYRIDVAKVTAFPGKHPAYAYNGTLEYVGFVEARNSSSLRVTLFPTATTTAYAGSGNVSLGNANARIQFRGTFPIVGWAATDIVTPESSISGQARYTTNTAQSIPNASATVIDFEDKVYDINNEVTTGAWKYTAKTAGYYQVNARVFFDSSSDWEAGELAGLYIFRSGVAQTYADGKAVDATVTQYIPASVSDVIYLDVGQYIEIKAYQNSDNARTLTADGKYNTVSISKVTGPGSQSFYISSPLVAPPDGTGIKLKSSTNADLMTISEAGTAAIGPTTSYDSIEHSSYGQLGVRSTTDSKIHWYEGSTKRWTLQSIGSTNGFDFTYAPTGSFGGISNAGAWTFPVNTTHKFGSTATNTTTQLQVNTGTGSGKFAQLDLYGGSNRYSLVFSDTNTTGYAANSLAFYNGSAYVGDIGAAGAWTRGPAAGGVTHTDYGAVATPTQVTLSDNVSMAGKSWAFYNTNAPLTINGLSGGVTGQMIVIMNDGVNNVTLTYNNAGGTQKFMTPNNASVVLGQHTQRLAFFGGTFWHILGPID